MGEEQEILLGHVGCSNGNVHCRLIKKEMDFIPIAGEFEEKIQNVLATVISNQAFPFLMSLGGIGELIYT